ncbi:MAG: hypothetical protein QF516_10320, partial [Pirellulaceae bacterium]|nr:hypothetical protein [Pirellulaceae bacterium]
TQERKEQVLDKVDEAEADDEMPADAEAARRQHRSRSVLKGTDGVVDGLWDRRIRELICSPAKSASNLPPANRLVKTAVSESGRDNATAVVLEVG